MSKKNPFQQQEAVPQGAAEQADKQTLVPEPTAKPINTSAFSKEEAKIFIAEQFKAGKSVFVIALQDGEHPSVGCWKRVGDKFKLEKAELYSHRWMKLA